MIKMEYADLTNLLEDARRIGEGKGKTLTEAKVNEVFKCLTDENTQLKTKLARAETQQMLVDQKNSFKFVHKEEQVRIVKGIQDYFTNIAKTKKKPTAEMLVFGLALGDLQ